MPDWVKKVFSLLPLDFIINYILGLLKEEAKKSSNTLDDTAVVIVEMILQEAGLIKKN